MGEGLYRLSIRPPGGQGRPYGDDVVALARRPVETTTLTQKEIGARIGVSHMSVGRWAKAGKWRRPPGAARAPGELSQGWSMKVRFSQRVAPWERLAEAEALIEALECRERAGLDGLEQALLLLGHARSWMERRRGHARAVGSRIP